MSDLADRMKSFLNAVHLAVQYQHERDEAWAALTRVANLCDDGHFYHQRWDRTLVSVVRVDEVRAVMEPVE